MVGAAVALTVLVPLGVAVAVGPARAAQRRSRLAPALTVLGVRSPCGATPTLGRGLLVVAFDAVQLVPGDRYVLEATGPGGSGPAPFLFELVARRATFASRGVRLYPIVSGDPLPRQAFVAHLELDDLGPVGGSPELYASMPSNPVTATVPACR